MSRRLAACSAALSLLVTVVGAPAAAAASAHCADIAVFASRGSGEEWNSGSVPGFGDQMSQQFHNVRRQFPGATMRTYANTYTPVPVKGLSAMLSFARHQRSYYDDSVERGVETGSAQLRRLMGQCVTSRIVLLGFSQGAQVNSDILQSLDAAAAARITVAMNFGDPQFNPRLPTPVGDFRADRHGLLGRGDGYGKVRHVYSVCHRNDIVCQGVFAWSFRGHQTYGTEPLPTLRLMRALKRTGLRSR